MNANSSTHDFYVISLTDAERCTSLSGKNKLIWIPLVTSIFSFIKFTEFSSRFFQLGGDDDKSEVDLRIHKTKQKNERLHEM